MKKFTAHDIAEYIIESFSELYEDGYYCVHYNPETGLNYKGNMDPENITVCARCDYADGLDRCEFDAKESENDPEFMDICEELAEKLNSELNS